MRSYIYRVIILSMAILSLSTSSSPAKAAPPPAWWSTTYLDGGGFWTHRVTVSVSSNVARDGYPETVAVGSGANQANIAGDSVRSLRLVDDNGRERLYDVTSSTGAELHDGTEKLVDGDLIIVPAVTSPGNTDVMTIYSGNDQAYELPDFLASVTNPGGPQDTITVGPVERLSLTALPVEKRWRVQGVPRLPLRVYNISGAGPTLVSCDIAHALVASRQGQTPQVRVFDTSTGQELPNLVQGTTITFKATLKPGTIATYHVYVGGAQTKLATLPDSALYDPARNLLQNADLADGAAVPAGWTVSAQNRAGGQQSPTGARVPGGHGVSPYSLQVSVPTGVTPGWFGWHQIVPVEPGATYHIGTWMKSLNLDAPMTINVHVLDQDKQMLTSGQYLQTSPQISGTADWTWVDLKWTAPADARFVELHLTSNAHGTMWFSGTSVRKFASGALGRAQNLESPETGSHLSVWQMPVTVKVFQDDPMQKRAESVSVKIARNESQSVQLAIRGTVESPHINVAVSSLRSDTGVVLAPPDLALVGYVPVDVTTRYENMSVPAWQRRIPTSNGASDGWPGLWPDPLPPYHPFELSANQTQPIWFTFHTTTNTAPGFYRGEITVSAGSSAETCQIPIAVRVYHFAMDDRPQIQVTYEFRDKSPSETKLLADYRVSGGDLPEPKMTLLPTGEVQIDFTEFDAAASYAFDTLHVSTMFSPQAFYALGWAYAPRDFLGLKAFTPEWDKAFRSAYGQYVAHLREKGWLRNVVFYLSDEPHTDQPNVADNLQQFSAVVRSVAPDVPVYSSTWTYMPSLVGAVTRWGVGIQGTFPVDEMQKRQAAGDTFWFTTDGTQCIDTPYNGSERLLAWFCFKYGILGHEFWGSDWYTYDPWKFGWHQFIQQADTNGQVPYWIRYPDGDGYVVYPGKDVGSDTPIPCIRLAAVRDGEYDYEYLTLLRSRIQAARAAGKPTEKAEQTLAMAESLVSMPNAGGLKTTKLMPNPTKILKLRELAGDLIDGM